MRKHDRANPDLTRPGRSPLTDQPTTKPADLIYEDTGATAPLVYFDIVGAYGTMNGSIEVELATRILVPKPDGSTEVKFISSGRLRCTAERRHQFAQRPRCGIEDAGAAARQHGGDCGGEAELSAGLHPFDRHSSRHRTCRACFKDPSERSDRPGSHAAYRRRPGSGGRSGRPARQTASGSPRGCRRAPGRAGRSPAGR